MVQKTEALRAFTFEGEIEHVVTAEWWEGPQGVGDVQQRGTTVSPGFSDPREGSPVFPNGWGGCDSPVLGCAAGTFQWRISGISKMNLFWRAL